MKKIIFLMVVCSPLTLMANDQIPVDDPALQDYTFAYERPGKRTIASQVEVKDMKEAKDVVVPKKKVESKQR